MKYILVLLMPILFVACNKTVNDNDDDTDPGNTDTSGVSAFFDHLDFFFSSKITGEVPAPVAISDLKKSFGDTLVIFEDLQTPFRFLHPPGVSDVAGAFISIPGSEFYYDVPELQDSKTNKTESVISMGFRSTGNTAPDVAVLIISPYDNSKKPIAKIKTKVNVKKPGDIDVNGFCGLMLEANEYWDWELSYIPGITDSGTITFINYPLKVWGAVGQQIEGSCCGQTTSIYGFCPGVDTANRSLHFDTFFGFPFEQFTFKSNQTFTRKTAQIFGKPNFEKSNWCTNFAKTDTAVQLVDYSGNWSISIRGVTSGMNVPYTTREYITLQTTSSQGGLGYGNPGGYIHLLQCGGYLWLIQPDLERADRNMYKFYKRKNALEETWHIIDS